MKMTCPACKEQITNLDSDSEIKNINARVSNVTEVIYTCPKCHAVLSVALIGDNH